MKTFKIPAIFVLSLVFLAGSAFAITLSSGEIYSSGLNTTIQIDFALDFSSLNVSNSAIIFYGLNYTNPNSCNSQLSVYSVYSYTTPDVSGNASNILPAIACPSTGTSPATGGGGGGGGAPSAAPSTQNSTAINTPPVSPEVIAFGNITNASTGIPSTITLSSASAGITSFTVTTTQNIPNATITLYKVNSSLQSTLQISSSGKIYQAFGVNLSGLNDSQISNVIINFRVNSSWVEENRINISGLSIYRNPGNGNWTELPTTFIGNDSSYDYFSALSPGFSIYAIFAKGFLSGGGNIPGINPAGARNFLESLTPSFFRHTELGYLLYYLLIFLVISGIVLVSYLIYRNNKSKKKSAKNPKKTQIRKKTKRKKK